jgi:hypothetical protein
MLSARSIMHTGKEKRYWGTSAVDSIAFREVNRMVISGNSRRFRSHFAAAAPL